ASEVSTLSTADGSYAFHNVPRNSTQTVRVQLREGYFQTAPPAPGTYTVQVGDDPFRIYDGNAFGVLPFSTVSGTVTGHLLNGGVLDPTATPLQGWTVVLQSSTDTPVTDLLFVTGVDAGGGASGLYGADAGFSGGATSHPTAAV